MTIHTTESIKQAYKMTKNQLHQALGGRDLWPPVNVWSKEELVSAWLERFGIEAKHDSLLQSS